MKRSDIRKIIKEELIAELRVQLTEAFADPIASKLNKMSGLNSRWRNFWDNAAKTYNIAWDKVPKGSFRKVSPTDKSVKTAMAFYVIENRKDNPYGGRWDTTLSPGVMAVTINGKVQYYSGNSGKIAAKGGRRQGDAVGHGVRGTLQVKKLAELADAVYVFDLESYRGGTKELKAKRAELKLGSETFTDHRAWKQSNIKRYSAMIADKIGSRDSVDTMVGKIVKIANETVSAAMELATVNQSGDIIATINNKQVTLKDVTQQMNNALEYYARYIRSENQDASFLKKYPEYIGSSTDSYEDGVKKDQALSIKTVLNKFKSGKLGW